MRFVVAFQPGEGHWSRLGAIAAALRARGHAVALATSAAFRPRLHGAWDGFLPVGPDWIEDQLLATPGTDARSEAGAVASLFFTGAPRVAADLAAGMAAFAPDALVCDYTLFGGPPAAHRLGVPWIGAYGLTVPFRPKGWPPFGSHLPPADRRTGRLGLAAIDRDGDRENRALYRPVMGLWRRAGVRLDSPWRAFARLARLGIVGAPAALDFPWPGGRPPPGIRHVGPLLDSSRPAEPVDDALAQFLAERAGGPLVHVTLGLTFSRRPELLARLIAALALLPCRLLVATGALAPEYFAQGGSRVLVRARVPHAAVFPHLDALVCHGGANTLMLALRHGTPALVLPQGAEQRGNGARFRHAGIGAMLLPREATAERLRAAVARLLDSAAGYRARCAALACDSAAAGGAAQAAACIEASLSQE